MVKNCSHSKNAAIGAAITSVRLRFAVQILQDHADLVLSQVVEGYKNTVISPNCRDCSITVLSLVRRDHDTTIISMVPKERFFQLQEIKKLVKQSNFNNLFSTGSLTFRPLECRRPKRTSVVLYALSGTVWYPQPRRYARKHSQPTPMTGHAPCSSGVKSR